MAKTTTKIINKPSETSGAGQQHTAVNGGLWSFLNQADNSVRFALIVTSAYFVTALFGMLHHELWRDEFQAWLVARDAHSFSQLMKNMKYEGNPALWHVFLYVITSFSHNPVYMQVFHLAAACSFIYIFNRYAPFKSYVKILFSFGYFSIYEYCIICRSYVLGLLLIFAICALYKNRQRNYIAIGFMLFFLANVSIYGVIFSLGFSLLLLIDYLSAEDKKGTVALALCAIIAVAGVLLSLWQIMPDKDNSFGTQYPHSFFEADRWATVFSRIFTTYFYVPKIEGIDFWNSNLYYDGDIDIHGNAVAPVNATYFSQWVILPTVVLAISSLAFLRKPAVLALYLCVTFGLLFVFYYTNLMFLRYCGFLLLAFVASYWISFYYPDRNYKNVLTLRLSGLGHRLVVPMAAAILLANVLGAGVAYSKDYQNKFSTSKDVAQFIRDEKLDTLTIGGFNHFIISPLAAHLDTQLYYFQMSDFGSFCIYNRKLKWQITDEDISNSLNSLLQNNRTSMLVVTNYDWTGQSTNHNIAVGDQHPLLARDFKIDYLKYFEPGIVTDEQFYLYIVRKKDPTNMLAKANGFKEKKQFDSAIFYYKKMISGSQDNADAFHGLGNTYEDIQKTDSAIAYLGKAATIAPKDAGIAADLGVAYFVSKKYREAEEQFRKMIDINPNDPKGYSNLGRTFFVQQQYAQAIEAFGKQMILDPGATDNLGFLALAYKGKGTMDSAIKYEILAQKTNPAFKL